MESNTMHRNLILYTLLTAAGLAYLVFSGLPGIGLPLFGLSQLMMLYFFAPKRKPLWLFVPIMILALNYFISANPIWYVPNALVILLLVAVMYLYMTGQFSVNQPIVQMLLSIASFLLVPLKYFFRPFQWVGSEKGKGKVIMRILAAMLISLPFIILIVFLLSQADQVFYKGVMYFFDNAFAFISFGNVIRYLAGLFVGLYFFTLLYAAVKGDIMPKKGAARSLKLDVMVPYVLLGSVLVIYSIFIVIQFTYLFAGAELPDGLTYTQYARKGFFELLFLSGVNILMILAAIWLGKKGDGKQDKVISAFCLGLCAVTIVLLASSFYRMWLYCQDDGLTRLRTLVFGFLIFEAIGLCITFYYIVKPKFNIVCVYGVIALVYYLLLNLVPIDYIVAKSQVDRYLSGATDDIQYISTLSEDAAPQMERLKNVDLSLWDKQYYTTYFERIETNNQIRAEHWQRFNLSTWKAQNISEHLR